MSSFPVRVIKPGQVAGTFYITPPNSKVKDALAAAGIPNLRSDEEVLLNGKPAKLDEDLIPQDTVEVTKKATPVVTVLPKGSGAAA